MASSSRISSTALFLALNILFFALVVSACNTCSPSPKPKPTPKPTPSPSPSKAKCPRDALKLGVCANLLGGLLNVTVGTPPKMPCCSLIQGLADLEAAACLCTVVKANVLGLVRLNVPLSLSLLVNYCGKSVPSGFICA